jgi:hypothetical protein
MISTGVCALIRKASAGQRRRVVQNGSRAHDRTVISRRGSSRTDQRERQVRGATWLSSYWMGTSAGAGFGLLLQTLHVHALEIDGLG